MNLRTYYVALVDGDSSHLILLTSAVTQDEAVELREALNKLDLRQNIVITQIY